MWVFKPNKFSILGRFFQNKGGFHSNRLAIATINQIVMKKAKFFIFHQLEKIVLKSGKNENQQFPGNRPNIENLFSLDSNFNHIFFIYFNFYKQCWPYIGYHFFWNFLCKNLQF